MPDDNLGYMTLPFNEELDSGEDLSTCGPFFQEEATAVTSLDIHGIGMYTPEDLIIPRSRN